MRTRILRLIPIAILLVTFGCATSDFGGSGQSGERRAQTLSQNGDYAASAAAYIGLAADASGSERDRLTMLAAQNWLDAGDGRRAKSALREVQKPAGGELLWLWSTDVAAMQLFEGRPDDALQILDPLSQQALTKQHRSRAEALRADAWFQKGDPSRAVRLYMQRENWLDTSIEIQRNRERMWAGLMVSNPQQMREAAEVSSDDISRGWLSLGALAASTGLQGIGWANGVQRWQESFSLHPAMGILDDMVLPEAGALDFPRRIALLLPTSGKNAAAGKAIQNGFFGAYFAAAAGLDDEQHVTVYDVANGGVAAAYARAVEDGAEFVVGPLLRRNVEILAAEPVLPVPVLSLNYLSDKVFAPAGFYQFALAPEDEAMSAATRATADGGINAVALYPNNDWGRRVASSFATELEASGGHLLDHTSYQAGTQDFSLEIESLMGLTNSVNRYKRMRANLGEPLQFDPRRRQDIDFVFLAADAKAGRLIKSQLKFHYAGDLPVYSTSFIYSMDGRSNRDLNDVMFADTPWIISPPTWIANYPEIYGNFWPAERRMGRLHAMGYDSYQLINDLFSSGGAAQVDLIGATGRLFLDNDGQVHRELAWAKFERGEVVALPAIDVPDGGDLFDMDTMEKQNSQPAEWPLQQLNP